MNTQQFRELKWASIDRLDAVQSQLDHLEQLSEFALEPSDVLDDFELYARRVEAARAETETLLDHLTALAKRAREEVKRVKELAAEK